MWPAPEDGVSGVPMDAGHAPQAAVDRQIAAGETLEDVDVDAGDQRDADARSDGLRDRESAGWTT